MDSEKPPVTERHLALRPDTGDDWEPPNEFDGCQLRGCIGKGAMGRVYKAYEHGLHRLVAVKFVEAVRRSEPEAYEPFVLEARAIARLQRPNVVAIYRIGEVNGRPYIAYEWVRGETLDQLALPLLSERVLQIGIGLARGLAAVHQHNVLHRDIKPGNVILADGREAKLLDFGLAKFVGEVNEDLIEQPASMAVGMGPGNGSNGAAGSRRSTERGRDIDPEKTREVPRASTTGQVRRTGARSPSARATRTVVSRPSKPTTVPCSSAAVPKFARCWISCDTTRSCSCSDRRAWVSPRSAAPECSPGSAILDCRMIGAGRRS